MTIKYSFYKAINIFLMCSSISSKRFSRKSNINIFADVESREKCKVCIPLKLLKKAKEKLMTRPNITPSYDENEAKAIEFSRRWMLFNVFCLPLLVPVVTE